MQAASSSWVFWALLSASFAALTAICAKLGVETINPDFATMLRTVVIVGVLAAIVSATHQWQPLGTISPRAYGFLVLSALGTGGSWLCYFRAMKLGEAARVAPVDKLSVLFVAVLAALFLGEKLSALNWLGVGLVGLGALLVAV